MSRRYSGFATDAVKLLLDRLLGSKGDPIAYRRAMTDLGERLGAIVSGSVPPSASVLVACTVEDADYLARGVLGEVSKGRDPSKRILVVAPVMHENARAGLESEFPTSVAGRFEYVYFAEDSVKTPAGEVQPGIGGSVYELLGFQDEDDKNRYRPEIVKQRRARPH